MWYVLILHQQMGMVVGLILLAFGLSKLQLRINTFGHKKRQQRLVLARILHGWGRKEEK